LLGVKFIGLRSDLLLLALVGRRENDSFSHFLHQSGRLAQAHQFVGAVTIVRRVSPLLAGRGDARDPVRTFSSRLDRQRPLSRPTLPASQGTALQQGWKTVALDRVIAFVTSTLADLIWINAV
jgi:hypothetical protein